VERKIEAGVSGGGAAVSGRVLHLVRSMAVVDLKPAASVDVEFREVEAPITVWWDNMPFMEAR
jgi:hypothetical protein